MGRGRPNGPWPGEPMLDRLSTKVIVKGFRDMVLRRAPGPETASVAIMRTRAKGCLARFLYL